MLRDAVAKVAHDVWEASQQEVLIVEANAGATYDIQKSKSLSQDQDRPQP